MMPQRIGTGINNYKIKGNVGIVGNVPDNARTLNVDMTGGLFSEPLLCPPTFLIGGAIVCQWRSKVPKSGGGHTDT